MRTDSSGLVERWIEEADIVLDGRLYSQQGGVVRSPAVARFSVDSLNGERANPAERIATSLEADWHSVYLRHSRCQGECEPYQASPTADQTIVVVLRGNCELRVQRSGIWQTVFRPSGSIGMTPGGESSLLSWKAAGPDAVFECAHLYVPPSFFEEAAEQYRQAGVSLSTSPLTCSGFEDDAVRHVIDSMVRGIAEHAPNLYAETTAQWLAVHLLAKTAPWRDLIQKSRTPGILTDMRLARVVEFMRENKGAAPSLSCLSEIAGISKFHFARLFKLKTGHTPLAYLYQLRMEAARQLLLTTDMPVKSIAANCGYHHAAHFVDAFRRFWCCTPSSMRSSRK